MLNHKLIRDRVCMIAEPGMFTEQAIKDITAEAERYAKEDAKKSGRPSLNPSAEDIRQVLQACLAAVRRNMA